MSGRRVPCVVCGATPEADERLVLARGARRAVHCSETCLGETLRQRRLALARRRRRAVAGISLAALLLAGGWTLRRHRAPAPRSISLSYADVDRPPAPPPEPTVGPAWPPTDDDWMFAFERARWTYPLPGPVRRAPSASDRTFAAAPAHGPAAVCRAPAACGVTVGGGLWGEHVYAALDGVVDRAHAGSDEHGGGTVRIAHLGGMVFTQYFHLAAIPRGVTRGAHVSAGDVIGLVGDAGGAAGERTGSGPHIHFALSVRP